MKYLAAVWLAVLASASCADSLPSKAELTAEATAIAGQFAGTLKPALKQAITEGGPVSAIRVCADTSPRIAADLSAESGWQVSRVSLQPRNPSAAPAPWQQQVLADFELQLADGADPQTLVYSDLGAEQFRFMKAQVTEPLCLLCHGTHLTPELSAAIAERYPQDSATGYQAGQVRGAISLIKTLGTRLPLITE